MYWRQLRTRLPQFLAAGLLLALSGCIAEAPGTVVFGLNESDEDVIVASTHHAVSPRVLPAHSWGKLFDDYDVPSGKITVYDFDCRVLATLPITRTLDTLRIASQNQIDLVGRGVQDLPPGVHRASDSPGDGTLWQDANCP